VWGLTLTVLLMAQWVRGFRLSRQYRRSPPRAWVAVSGGTTSLMLKLEHGGLPVTAGVRLTIYDFEPPPIPREQTFDLRFSRDSEAPVTRIDLDSHKPAPSHLLGWLTVFHDGITPPRFSLDLPGAGEQSWAVKTQIRFVFDLTLSFSHKSFIAPERVSRHCVTVAKARIRVVSVS
jgi:hypothetical protein